MLRFSLLNGKCASKQTFDQVQQSAGKRPNDRQVADNALQCSEKTVQYATAIDLGGFFFR